MDKRRFLKLIATAVLGCPQSTVANGSTSANSRGERVVVIGAGLAGLAAARELQAQGFDVVVVEARDRIGGRIWTSSEWDTIPLDLGASWIHGVEGNPLTDLADEIDANRLVTSYDKAITYDASGKPVEDEDEERLDKLRTKLYRAIRSAQSRDDDISLRQAIAPLATDDKRLVDFIVSSEFEQEFSGSAANLSAHWFDQAAEFEGDDALFANGFRAIPEFLAEGLTIKLGQVVREVQWSRSPVRVVTQDSAYEAEHVVVTLPLGVLKSGKIVFTPDLPKKKSEAIKTLGMGVLNKCYLLFDKPFWPKDVDWLEYIADTPGAWTQWVSLLRVANQPVLLGFNAADRGREIESWSDEKIVADAMRTLRAIFGERIPEPLRFQITRWAKDPFAHGSYSYNAVGSTPRMREALASSLDNKVFFAGEAAHSAYFGTAHGAYLSGLTAAKEILGLDM